MQIIKELMQILYSFQQAQEVQKIVKKYLVQKQHIYKAYWDEETSPVYKEKNVFTRDKFCKKLNITGCTLININILNETTTGRIKNLIINNKKFTGTDVAYLLGIKSNYFDIYIENDSVVVETKGFGHGVGMSQYGANGMANEGYNYIDILNHYYTNVSIY